jgi:hypothetical protein
MGSGKKVETSFGVWTAKTKRTRALPGGVTVDNNTVSVLSTSFTVDKDMVTCSNGAVNGTEAPVYMCKLDVAQFDIMPRGFCFHPMDGPGTVPLYPWLPKCNFLVQYKHQLMPVSDFKRRYWK